MKPFLFYFLVLLLGCNQNNDQSEPMVSPGRSLPVEKINSEESELDLLKEPKIVKNGNIRFKSNDLVSDMKFISDLVLKNKGQLTSESTNNYGNTQEVNLQLKIPSSSFELFIQEIEKKVGYLEQKNINAQDLSEEYVDIAARLNTKRTFEKRLLELVNSAKKVEDLIVLERQLSEIRGEIESAETRLKTINRDVQYSNLSVSFYKESIAQKGIVKEVLDGFARGWDFVYKLFIFLISIWPLFILIPLFWWLTKRFIGWLRSKTWWKG
jgi:DNA mismatch repair ATPase MutS